MYMTKIHFRGLAVIFGEQNVSYANKQKKIIDLQNFVIVGSKVV